MHRWCGSWSSLIYPLVQGNLRGARVRHPPDQVPSRPSENGVLATLPRVVTGLSILLILLPGPLLFNNSFCYSFIYFILFIDHCYFPLSSIIILFSFYFYFLFLFSPFVEPHVECEYRVSLIVLYPSLSMSCYWLILILFNYFVLLRARPRGLLTS